MADQANAAEAPTETPEARLKRFGFTNELGYWRTPNGDRLLSTADAVVAMDSGEVEPFSIPWPGVTEDTAANFRLPSEEAMDRRLGRNQPPPEPPEPPAWLLAQAEVIASATVEKLKPIIRAEIRAELRKAAKP